MIKPYYDGAWHSWTRGPCPVGSGVHVEVILQGQDIPHYRIRTADFFNWEDGEVNAFRVVLDEPAWYGFEVKMTNQGDGDVMVSAVGDSPESGFLQFIREFTARGLLEHKCSTPRRS